MKIKYKPLPHQSQFHNSTTTKTLLIGGLGTLSFNSLIFDADLNEYISIKKLIQIKRRPTVLSWTPSGWIKVKASMPYFEGVGEMYRVKFLSGKEIHVGDNHRFLTSQGFQRTCDLARLSTVLSPRELYGKVPRDEACGPSESEKQQDLKDDCWLDLDLCDEQPLDLKAFCQRFSQQPSSPSKNLHYDWHDFSLSCDRRHNRNTFLDRVLFSSTKLESFVYECNDEPALPYTAIKELSESSHKSNPSWKDVLSYPAMDLKPTPLYDNKAQHISWEYGISLSGLLEDQKKHQDLSPPALDTLKHLNGQELSPLLGSHAFSYSKKLLKESSHEEVIESIEHIGKRAYFDIHVPVTNNYVANGVVNHNSGKTHSLIMEMFRTMNENPGVSGAILCPTLKMAKRDVIPTFYDIARENHIRHNYNKSSHEFYFPQTNSKVYILHGEDEGRSIRGPNLGWMLINEFTLISKETYLAALSRVRDKRAKRPVIKMSGSPEAFNWVYEEFIEISPPDTTVINASSRENPYLSDGYIKMLEESYDEETRKQFIDGLFVNRNGKAALHKFDRRKHVEALEFDPSNEIWISMDFNIQPMAANLWYRLPDIEGELKLYCFDEINLTGRSDTDQMCQAIYTLLGHKNVVIFPDPAGDAGSTKSRGRSDIDVLKEFGFKDIRYHRSIKSVMDCLNATNRMLERGSIKIHPKCKQLISDAEQCMIKGNSIDKKNQARTHWLDGFKDMVDYEFPVKAKSGGWRHSQLR